MNRAMYGMFGMSSQSDSTVLSLGCTIHANREHSSMQSISSFLIAGQIFGHLALDYTMNSQALKHCLLTCKTCTAEPTLLLLGMQWQLENKATPATHI